MDHKELVNKIGQMADAIKPFTFSLSIGQSHWNGEKYAPVVEERSMDPYALGWWCTLETISVMIAYQDAPLSDKQVEYVRHKILGGMGSLNDFRLDDRKFGEEARTANRVLDELSNDLYNVLASKLQGG